MKALILAGGRGTRLRPLTHTKNKHMLPIGNRPMIERIIRDAVNLGITDIIINVNMGDKEIPELIGMLQVLQVLQGPAPDPHGRVGVLRKGVQPIPKPKRKYALSPRPKSCTR